MKKLVCILAFLLLAVPAFGSTSLTVNATYVYSATGALDTTQTPPAFPACSSTVTTNCITGFNVYDVTSTKTLIGTIPNSTTPTGKQNVSDTFVKTYTPGNYSIDATCAYKDANGNAAEGPASSPVPFTVNAAAVPGSPSITVTVTVTTN